MMFTSEKPVAEPNSDAIQARQSKVQWDAPSPTLFPLILHYSFAVLFVAIAPALARFPG